MGDRTRYVRIEVVHVPGPDDDARIFETRLATLVGEGYELYAATGGALVMMLDNTEAIGKLGVMLAETYSDRT